MQQLHHLHQNFNVPLAKFDMNNPSSRLLACRCSLHFSPENEASSVQRIREWMLCNEVKLSVSAYDTAWVAMVPSRPSTEFPIPNKLPLAFPECLRWVLENQQEDGSWRGLRHRLLVKDSLLSTLACLLPLRKWCVGYPLLQRGLEFIGSNIWAACDPKQLSPVGFDVLFPGMIKHAIQLDLNLPLDATLLDQILCNHELEIARIQGNDAALAYLAEGIGTSSFCWKKVMKIQKTNGSFLISSPAAIAAALNQNYDDELFAFLSTILNKCANGSVFTVYPSSIYIPLKMVDVIQKLGLKRYFTLEIDRVLDQTYR